MRRQDLVHLRNAQFTDFFLHVGVELHGPVQVKSLPQHGADAGVAGPMHLHLFQQTLFAGFQLFPDRRPW